MKIKYIVKVLIIGILIITISNCKKETVDKPKESIINEAVGIKINKEQKIIDLDSTNTFEINTTDTIEYNNQKFLVYEIEIEGNTEEVSNIDIGTVLNIPEGSMGGKLVFVYEIEDISSKKNTKKGTIALIIKGFQATLDMYFNYENATLEFSTPDNRSKKNLDIPNKLIGGSLLLGDKEISFTAKNKDFEIDFSSSPDKICKLGLSSKIWQSDDSYLSVDGTISLHPALDFFMKYEPIKGGSKVLGLLEAAAVPDPVLLAYKDKNYFLGNMKELKANIYLDIDKDITVRFHLAKEFKPNNPFQIPIGSLIIPTVPVSAQIEMAFEVDLKAVGAIDLELYEIEEFDIAFGVDLDRDLPKPVWYFEKSNRSESGLILKAKVELTAGLSLILETEVYILGVVGPELKIGGFIEGTATVEGIIGTNDPLSANWKLSADAGFRAEAKLNLSAFHVDKATWSIWDKIFLEYRENIYLAPHHLGVISGNNQIGYFGQPLSSPIEIGTYDSKDILIDYLPIPIYFETLNGDVNSSWSLTNNGIASTNWTLGNSNSEQKLGTYFKDGENKKGKIEINATATHGSGGIETGTVTDIDGNIYKTVKIGNQWWMSEDLKVTNYSDGTPIPDGTGVGGDASVFDEKKYWFTYDDNIANKEEYGLLYSWYAIMNGGNTPDSNTNPSNVQGIAPEGWHIPSQAEWIELERALGYTENDYSYYNNGHVIKPDLGHRLKEPGNLHWNNTYDLTNVGAYTGFNALPSGRRLRNGSFVGLGSSANYWTTTSRPDSPYYAWDRIIVSGYAYLNTHCGSAAFGKTVGQSIRCVKD